MEACAKESFFDSDLLVKILDLNSDSIIILDPGGKMLYINQGGRALMGLSGPENYFHRHWTSLWPSSKRNRLDAFLQRALTGEASKFKEFCPTAKQEPKWWEVNIHPLCDPCGKCLFILAISHDITRQKLLEDNIVIMSENKDVPAQISRREMKELQDQLIDKHLALEKTQALLQLVINNTSELILVFDRNLNYTLVNRQASEFMGLSAEEISGRNLLDIYPGVTASGLYRSLLKCLSGEIVHQPHFESYNKPGVFFDATFRPIREDELVTGAMIAARMLN